MNIPLIKTLITTLILTLITSLSFSQILEFKFDATPPSGIFLNNDVGNTAITSWIDGSNILDGASSPNPGFFTVDNTGTSFDGLNVIVGAKNYTNWTGAGLADGGSGINASGEYISFSFNRDVQFVELDLANFTNTNGNNEATSLSLTLSGIDTPLQSILAENVTTGIIPLNLGLKAGDSLKVEWSDAGGFASQFDIQSFTLSAVPEPSTFIGLGAGFALLLFLKRKKNAHRTETSA